MEDKEFLERMLSMLPKEFQDIYDDTIPEAKEVRKKMSKKKSAPKLSYSCSMPMIEDIRNLGYESQAKVCKSFHQLVKKQSLEGFFITRFEETYSRINMKNLEESIEAIHYTVNDLDNAISEIDFYDPMLFFEVAKTMAKVIAKEKK